MADTKLDANQVLKGAYDEPNKRLRVDASVTATLGDTVLVDANGDELDINPDGSINTVITGDVNIEISAADGDNVLVVGTEDGTTSGTQHVVKINAAKEVQVRDDDANATLTAINAVLSSPLPTPTGAATAANQVLEIASLSSIDSKLPVLGQHPESGSVSVVLASDQDIISVGGTDDGLATGTPYGLVYNQKEQILASHDKIVSYTYADFGTKNERIIRIDYTSPTFTGVTARRDFSYTLLSSQYRLDTEVWYIV